MNKNTISTYKKAARKKALKELLIGLGVAALGALISWGSYSSAKPGGRYTVYTGIIVLGVIYAGKGAWGLIFPFGLRGDKAPLAPQQKSDQKAETKAKAAAEAEVVADDEEPSKD